MRYDDATREEIHYEKMAEEARLARIERNAKLVELLHRDPVSHVQYSLFSIGQGLEDVCSCVLVLESRSEVELLVPRICLKRVENEQIDYVENEGEEFFLWIGGAQIKCYVETITYDLRGSNDHAQPS